MELGNQINNSLQSASNTAQSAAMTTTGDVNGASGGAINWGNTVNTLLNGGFGALSAFAQRNRPQNTTVINESARQDTTGGINPWLIGGLVVAALIVALIFIGRKK